MKKGIMLAAALFGANQVSASGALATAGSFVSNNKIEIATAAVVGAGALYLGKVATRTNAGLVAVGTFAGVKAVEAVVKAMKVRKPVQK